MKIVLSTLDDLTVNANNKLNDVATKFRISVSTTYKYFPDYFQ